MSVSVPASCLHQRDRRDRHQPDGEAHHQDDEAPTPGGSRRLDAPHRRTPTARSSSSRPTPTSNSEGRTIPPISPKADRAGDHDRERHVEDEDRHERRDRDADHQTVRERGAAEPEGRLRDDRDHGRRQPREGPGHPPEIAVRDEHPGERPGAGRSSAARRRCPRRARLGSDGGATRCRRQAASPRVPAGACSSSARGGTGPRRSSAGVRRAPDASTRSGRRVRRSSRSPARSRSGWPRGTWALSALRRLVRFLCGPSIRGARHRDRGYARSMQLTPTEEDRLRVFTAAQLARATLAKGLRLNAPEAVALVCDEMHAAGRSGALLRRGRRGRPRRRAAGAGPWTVSPASCPRSASRSSSKRERGSSSSGNRSARRATAPAPSASATATSSSPRAATGSTSA